jgi:hypothetical protein
MIDQDTMSKLRKMRLSGMAECFEQAAAAPGGVPLSGVVWFGGDGFVWFGDGWGGVMVVGGGMMVTISH